MNRQFIQGLSIDWSKIDSHSYLREIEAINQLEEVVFEKPITFFVGLKMAAENQRCWKLLRYPMDLIRKAARKIILFQPMIPIFLFC